MRQASFLASANGDLRKLRIYLTEASGSRAVSRRFVSRLKAYCHHLATLPFQMGVSRVDLAPDLRSAVFESYVIFFRYAEDRLEIINILEGHRDIPEYFSTANPE